MEKEMASRGAVLSFERLASARHVDLPAAADRSPAAGDWRHPSDEPSAQGFKLSIAMAAHNEAATIDTAITQLLRLELPFDHELIVVDDGSTDETPQILRRFADEPTVVLRRHPVCMGKGAALLSAAAVASGTHLLIFDADLEYSPEDIGSLVDPVLRGVAPVVYGARVPGMRTSYQSLRYALGSKVTTVFANVLFDSWLTDIHTCLKLMPLRLFRDLSLHERGFGLDTEITAELLRRGMRPYEVPCSYRGRTVAEGKKISARDGLECLALLMKVRLRGRTTPEQVATERRRLVAFEQAPVRPTSSDAVLEPVQGSAGGATSPGLDRRKAAVLSSGGR